MEVFWFLQEKWQTRNLSIDWLPTDSRKFWCWEKEEFLSFLYSSSKFLFYYSWLIYIIWISDFFHKRDIQSQTCLQRNIAPPMPQILESEILPTNKMENISNRTPRTSTPKSIPSPKILETQICLVKTDVCAKSNFSGGKCIWEDIKK